MRADDAGEAVKTDEDARVAAHGVRQIDQRHGRPTQRPRPCHVTWYGG